MKTIQTTIKDIAKELNISPSTVSRALKNHPDISQETKKNVMELAEKMDYQPNFVAWSLRKSKTNTIGIVLPKIVHHFFSTVISGIEDIAHDEGYNIIIAQSNESYEREVANVHAMMLSRVDAMFVSLSSETTDFEHLRALNKKNIPLIFFDRHCAELGLSSVVVDDYGGAFKAVEHLIEMGCTNIVHLAGPDKLLISQNRLKGYMDALKKNKLPINESLIIKADKPQKAFDCISDLIDSKTKFDGIFTVNDDTAIGAIKALKHLGLSIPKDVAVIGFGDDPVSEVIEPHLSSISQSGFEMGQSVAKIFLKQVEREAKGFEDYEAEFKMLETKLLVRESSRRK